VPNVSRVVRRELEATRHDVIFCEFWYWDSKVYEAQGLKVIDANDVQSHRHELLLERSRNPLERLMKPYLVKKYRSREAEALNRADVVVAVTTKDRDEFERMITTDTERIVTPTGLDTDYFVPQPQKPDLRNVVFYGALGNPMNRDAVQYLVREIFPRVRRQVPGARLTLVGSSPPPEVRALPDQDPAITVTGFVEDVRGPLAEAGVVVCPLRFGYGIRGRIFELLSMAVPVVATPVAVDGMELSSGDGVILADDAASFANAVAQVLTDATLREDLARRGRDIAVGRMSMSATYDRLAEYLVRRSASEPLAVKP
jgi:glycosyltransferase involved in cell wall biosynthesis